MLLDALASNDHFGSAVRDDLAPCRVPDIFGYGDLKVLFIAESPHTDEVRFGAPFSGRSGRDMTRVLLDRVFDREDIPEPLPFGRCMQFHSRFFRHFGVMNVCNLPLQEAALKDKAAAMPAKYPNLFDAFKTIRGNPTAVQRQSQTVARVDAVILDDFTRRLRSCSEPGPLIIPCGNMARAFVDKSDVAPDPDRYLNRVPHPSYGQWLQAKHGDIINDMCRRIREQIET